MAERAAKVSINDRFYKVFRSSFFDVPNTVKPIAFDDPEGNFLSKFHILTFLEPLTQVSATIFSRDLVFVIWSASIIPARNYNQLKSNL